MYKRIISIMLVFVVLGSMITWVYAENTQSYNNEAIELVTGLGLMEFNDEEECGIDDTATREGFAGIISGILNYNREVQEIAWNFYGADDETAKQPEQNAGQEVSPYFDVDTASEYYSDIKNVTDLRLMSGYGGYFNPTSNITKKEAITVFLRLLGYDTMSSIYGGFYSGYMKTAMEIGLDTSNAESELTYGNIAVMLAQAAEAPVMLVEYDGVKTSYTTDKDKTLLTELLNIEKTEGTLNQNNITSLTGKSTGAYNSVKIDDLMLTTTDETRYVNRFIGRQIKCYYFGSDSEKENEIVYAFVSSKTEEITFDIDDFEKLEKGSVSYKSDNRVVSKKIAQIPYVIYNGVAATSCKDEYFDYDNGSVTLVSTNNDGNYNLIIIEGYRPVYVKRVNRENGKFTVLNDIAGADNPNLAFDEEQVGKEVTIQNKNGEALDLSMIEKDTVLDVSRNGDVVSIIVCDKTVIKDFKINSVYDNKIEGNDGAVYEVSESYIKSDNYQPYKAGEVYTLYINSFGYVAKLSVSKEENTWEFGYVYKFIYDPNAQELSVRIITESRKTDTFILTDKISYNDENGKDNVRRDSDDKLYAELSVFNKSVIRYKVNADNNITAIEVPLKKGVKTESSDRLYLMVDTRQESNAGYYYSSGFKSFGSKIFMADDVRILSIPQSEDEINKYSFTSTNVLQGGTKTFAAYGLDQESVLTSYVCLHEAVSSVFEHTEYAYIVTNIYQGLDENNEVVRIVEAYQSGKTYKFYDDAQEKYLDNAVPFGRWEEQDKMNSNEYYKVDKGDLIRIKADAFGKLMGVQIIFDCDGIYDNSKYADMFGSASGFDESFTWKEKGTFAGSLGYFTKDITNTNPATSKTTVAIKGANAANYSHNGYPRFIYGYVYDLRDGIITYTTKNLHESPELPDESDTRFVTESRRIGRVSDLLTIDGDYITASAATEDKIKTFKDFGSDCSRIIFQSEQWDDRFGIIINGVKE